MIKNLQSLRVVFSFCIFVSHLLGQQYSTFGLGEYGVVGFFMLSGFVLSVAYGPKIEQGRFCTWPFFCKQWAKLYPLHIATFLLAIVYEAHYGNTYEWKRLLPPVFLLQSWIPNERFHHIPNGSSWSLCGFFFFYIVFSALYVLLNRLHVRQLLTLVTVCLLAYVGVVLALPAKVTYAFVYASPLMRLPDFAIGIALCRLLRSDWGEQRLQARLRKMDAWRLTLLELAILVLPVAAFLVYKDTNAALRCVSLFWPFVALQLLLFSWSDRLAGGITRCFHTKPMMFLGGISFEIYLIHMFVVPIARSVAFRLGLCPIGLFSLTTGFAVTVALSYVAKRYYVDKVYTLLKYHLPKI